MKTRPLDYNKLYSEARTSFFNNSKSYSLERKTESLAYLIALESGLRVSDLLSLKFYEIQFNQDIRKYCFTTNIKKTKNTHTGIISNELYNYIEMFKGLLLSKYQVVNDSIFYNYKTNQPYTRQWLHKRIKLIAEKLGFEDSGVHSIRKASAINVLDKTGSLSLAQYHLTHKRASTTDIYLNVSKNSALERLSKIY